MGFDLFSKYDRPKLTQKYPFTRIPISFVFIIFDDFQRRTYNFLSEDYLACILCLKVRVATNLRKFCEKFEMILKKYWGSFEENLKKFWKYLRTFWRKFWSDVDIEFHIFDTALTVRRKFCENSEEHSVEALKKNGEENFKRISRKFEVIHRNF